MILVEYIRNLFLQCPYLDKLSPVNVDYLGNEVREYTIDVVPSEQVIKTYVDGSAMKQFVFLLGSREYYGPNVLQNIENSGVYENISNWLKDISKEGLPSLSDNRKPIKIETLTSGYLFDSTGDNGRYQIQARLVYYEE